MGVESEAPDLKSLMLQDSTKTVGSAQVKRVKLSPRIVNLVEQIPETSLNRDEDFFKTSLGTRDDERFLVEYPVPQILRSSLVALVASTLAPYQCVMLPQ